jgi:hypothetical protein
MVSVGASGLSDRRGGISRLGRGRIDQRNQPTTVVELRCASDDLPSKDEKNEPKSNYLVEKAVRTLTFPQYRDWRNYGRLEGEIKALYELIQTGKRSYFE